MKVSRTSSEDNRRAPAPIRYPRRLMVAADVPILTKMQRKPRQVFASIGHNNQRIDVGVIATQGQIRHRITVMVQVTCVIRRPFT